jgi:maltose 6'-phosphate phosphatase
LDVVAQAIIEQGCDVVALQEVNQHQNSPAVDANILTNHTVLADNYGYLLQKTHGIRLSLPTYMGFRSSKL